MTEESGVRGLAPTSAGAAHRGAITVEVVIPADPTQLVLLRRVAAAVATSLDFDIDTLADLKMAVDQVGTMAVDRAATDSPITFRMSGSAASVTATASVAAATADPVDEHGFDWLVLKAITESLSWTVAADLPDSPRLTVTVAVRPHRVGV